MNTEAHSKDITLEDAFHLFNEMSLKLTTSYGDLESRVEQLSGELSQARSERLEQLAEKEILANRLEKLLHTLPAGVVVLDEKGHVSEANPVANEMLGSAVLSQCWTSLVEEVFVIDGDELRLRDGRWVSISMKSLETEAGKIIVITDITETHELQKMLNRQQRLTSLGEMVASLAHQIRTPLSSVLLHLSNITIPSIKDLDRGRYASKAKEQIRHLERLVSDMLLFARGDEVESEEMTLAELIDELACRVEPLIHECGGKLVITNQAPTARIVGNRDALTGAFLNLVTNAIEANDGALLLEIKIFMNSDNSVTMMFRDNGPGIAEVVRERILEPFFTTKNNGTGLGMSVVNATVGSHKGKLWIEPEVDKGACVHISLPLSGHSRALSADISANNNVYLAIPRQPRYQGNYLHYFLDNNEGQR